MSTVENRERILARLESGEDRQARVSLREPDGCMCFQGVIADEFIKATGRGSWLLVDLYPNTGDGHIDMVRFVLDEEVSTSWLPYEVEEWSGLSDREIVVGTALNDEGQAFPEIAKVIRAGVED